MLLLTVSIEAANAQQVPPPPNGAASYAVPPQVPSGTPPAVPMMQMPPPAYGGPMDQSQAWQGQYPPQQYAQWGPPPNGMPQGAPPMSQAQGYPPQGYGAPMEQQPPRMSHYDQQEAALRESQMVEQLEDVKQQKEMEESFRHGILSEFDDSNKNGASNTGFNGDQSKVKTVGKKAGGALKTGMRWCAPTASYIGTFFILRGMTGGF